MEIQEIHIKEVSSGEFQVPEQVPEAADYAEAEFVRINLKATIQNGNLKQIKVCCQNLKFSDAHAQLPLVPGNLCKEFEAVEYSWEYLEKLTKFLNEILKLRKK